MPLILDCPACQRKLRVPDTLLGQTVKCPTCGETFTATGSTPEPGPAPSSSEPFRFTQEELDRARPSRRPSPGFRDEDEEDPEYGDRPHRRRLDLAPHRGTTVLVLGILSLVVCAPLGIAAWVMGNSDLRQMDAGQMDRSGRDTTNAGKICGIIGTVLFGCSCIGGILYFAIIAAAIGAAGPPGRRW